MGEFEPTQTADSRRGGSAPRFLVIYCSVMIILLAFFILLQTLETSKERTTFQKGKGSFVRALETYGLGRVMGRELPNAASGARMPRMYGTETAEGGRDAPEDPEMEGAEQALEELTRRLESDTAPPPGRKVMLALPLEADGGRMGDRHRTYLRKFARRLLSSLLGRNCVVNIAVLYRTGEDQALKAARRASRVARTVRDHLLASLPQGRRRTARRLTYSSCRSAPGEGAGEQGPLSVRLGVLMPQNGNEKGD